MKAILTGILVSTLFAASAQAAEGEFQGGGVWHDSQGRANPYRSTVTATESGNVVEVVETAAWTNPENGETVEITRTLEKRFQGDGAFDYYLIPQDETQSASKIGQGNCVSLETDEGPVLSCSLQYTDAQGYTLDVKALHCESTGTLTRHGTMKRGFETHTFTEILIRSDS